MMRFVKKGFFTAWFLCLLLIAVSVCAEEIVSADGLYAYTLSGNDAMITGYLGKQSVVTLPEQVDGYPVTALGKLFSSDDAGITEITIPGSVKTIGNSAFDKCTSLTTVHLSEGLETIGSSAFYGCEKLSVITLPTSVRSIGAKAFYNCDALTSITVPEGVTAIEDYAFYDCYRLQKVVLPDSVESIGNGAFGYCYNLAVVNMPKNLKRIGERAFADTALTSAAFPEGLQEIGGYAFWDSKLISISLPSTVKHLKGENGYSYAFSNCSNLTNLTIVEGMEEIGSGAFSNCGMKKVTLPDSVKTIRSGAFSSCRRLVSIVVPRSVTEIASDAFSGCESVTLLVEDNSYALMYAKEHQIPYEISGGTESQRYTEGDFVFTKEYGRAQIVGYKGHAASLTIPAALGGCPVETIATLAFENCADVQEIVIPEGVREIELSAFVNCDNLRSMVIPESVSSIGRNAFSGCNQLVLTVVKDSAAYTYARNNSIDYIIEEDGFYYTDKNWSTTVVAYRGNAQDVVFPASLTSGYSMAIGENVFKGHDEMVSAVVPNSCSSIGAKAFADCAGLTSVVIPNNVHTIADDAFENSPNVELFVGEYSFALSYAQQHGIPYAVSTSSYSYKVTKGLATITGYKGTWYDWQSIPATLGGYPVGAIANNAFCRMNGMVAVAIPNSVTSIGARAFGDCDNLVSVTIPASVTEMGARVFEGSPNVVLNVEEGSYALAYAQKNGLNYKVASGEYLFSVVDGKTFVEGYTGSETQLVIPGTLGGNPVRGIAQNAFRRSNLVSAELPDGLVSIGSRAFGYCYDLTKVQVPASVTEIAEDAFLGCYTLVLVVEKDSYALSYAQEHEIMYVINGEVQESDQEGDFRYTTANGRATIVGYLGQEKKLTIPTALNRFPVTAIGNMAFAGNNTLSSTIMQEGVTDIGIAAFANCPSLGEVYIPRSVQRIAQNAFDGSWGAILYGYSGSAAQEFAWQYGWMFMHADPSDHTFGGIENLEIWDGELYEWCLGCDFSRTKEMKQSHTYPVTSEDQLGDSLSAPQLVLGSGANQFKLSISSLMVPEENKAVYDLVLVDAQGKPAQLEKECLLYFPYPKGMDASSFVEFSIEHKMEDENGDLRIDTYSNGDIIREERGMMIRIHHLSPFVLSWQQIAPPENLPQTGDSSLPVAVYAMIMLGCTVIILALKRRHA